MATKRIKEEPKQVASWGKMLTKEELLALLARLEAKKLARKHMAEEAKKSKNPFIAAAQAAKAAASNPSVPGSKTTQVQQAKNRPQVSGKKPTTRSAGRGR
jgi:hypothetical protein